MDLECINKPLKDKEEWDTPCLCLDLHEQPGREDSQWLPTQHDLTTFFPPEVSTYYNVGGGRKKDKRRWFGLNYKDSESIVTMINKSCMKGGYNIINRNTKPGKTHTLIRLQCQCGRRAQKSVATKRTTTSTKVQDKDQSTCKMYFNIFYDHDGPYAKQYYIRQNGGHCFHHSGHAPVQMELKRVEKRHVQKKTIDDIENLREQSTDRAERKNDNGNRNDVMTIEMMQKPQKQSCHTRVMPTFRDTTELCKSEEDIQGLKDVLTQYQAKMMCKKVSKEKVETVSSGSTVGILSFPTLEMKKEAPRHKSVYSPSKRK